MATTAAGRISGESDYKEGLRVFIPRLFVSLVLFAFVLVVVETGCFLFLKHKSPAHAEVAVPPASIYPDRTEARKLWREWQAAKTEMQYRAYIVWRGQPFQGRMITVDSDGLRHTSFSTCKPGAYTVWMFGASTLWGMGVPDWQTIPSLVAKQYQDTGRSVCVINYAQDGWVGTQEVIQLLLALKADSPKPNLVVFYDGAPDVFLPYETDAGDVHGNYSRMRLWFSDAHALQQPGFAYLKKTNSYRVLELIAARLSNAPTASTQSRDVNLVARKTLDNYVKNMELVETLGQRFGFSSAFFWQPTTLAGSKPLTPQEEAVSSSAERRNPGITQVFSASYALAKNLQRPNYFYLGDIFQDQKERVFIDITHVGQNGDAIIAKKMFTELKNLSASPMDSK